MRKILAIFVFAFCAFSADAASRIVATVTITNAPTTNGMTFVLNGDTRTWTNNVVTPASQILTNAAIGGIHTNLYNHITAKMFAGPVNVSTNGTNIIIFRGQVNQALVIAFTGDYASVTYDTNDVTAGRPVIIPISAEPVASERTNISSGIIAGVNVYSTNAINQTNFVASELVGLTNTQTIIGVKTMTGANLFASASQLFSGGAVSNVVATNIASFNGTIIGTVTNTDGIITGGILTNSSITNAFAISGTVWRLTNGGWIDPSLTNGINYGNAFSSRGDGSNSEKFGQSAAATAANSLAIGSAASVEANGGVALGRLSLISTNSDNSVNLGAFSLIGANCPRSILIGTGGALGANVTNGIGIGYATLVTHNDSVALGSQVTTTDTNQIRLGSTSISVSVRQNASIGNNLAVGNDWEKGFVDSMAKGVLVTNGTAAAADPTNAVAFWSASGEWQYRTSGSSEGAGQVNRVHNRGSQVTGSGSDFTIAGTSYARVDFGGQDPEIVLPTAGTYIVHATVEVLAGVVGNDTFNFKLLNSTDAADVTSSDQRITNVAATQTDTLSWPTILTVTATKTIQLYAQNSTAARGTITAVRTKIFYVRLY